MIKKHKAMLRYHFCISYLILVILLPLSTLAQVSPYKNYTVADGLLSNKVFAICQDSTGYMYFATDRGISVFNGHSFKNFTVKEGMPTNIYYGLYKDKWNRVWAQSTSDQLIAFKDGEISNNYFLESECRQLNIYEGIKGICVLDNLGNFYREDREKNKITQINLNAYIKNKHFKNFIPLNDDLCLLISNEKIELYLINECGYLSYLNDIDSNKYKISKFKSIYAYKVHNNIFLFVNNENILVNISLKLNKIFSIINLKKYISQNNITYLPTIKDNKLYIESSNKYLTIDTNLNIKTNLYNVETNIEYTRNHIDRNNNLWIGSNYSGVFLNTFNKNEIININFNPNFGRFCKINGYKNDVYVGTTKGILLKLEKNKLVQIANLALDPIHSIDINDTSIIVANTLNVFEINTTNGLINKDYFTKFKHIYDENKLVFKYPLQKDICKYIHRDNEYIYISRLNDFIAINNKSKNFQSYFLSDGYTNHISTTKDRVYFSINNNLFYINKPIHDSIKKSINITQPMIISDLDVSKNKLIISTNNEELIILDSNLNLVNKFHGTSRINNLYINNENSILSTSGGINYIDLENKLSITNSISSQDGLLDRNILDVYTYANNLYSISNSTFSKLDYKNYKIDTFLNLKINLCHHFECYSKNSVSITRSNSSFKIVLEPFEYNSLDQKKYHYKIDGLQSNWNTTSNPEINFNLTNPGTYTFRCKLENYKGQISPNESNMQIILLPRWYETLFFRILGIIILVSMLTGSIQFVLKRKKKTEKARLMADIQISDVKLESLRAQMNPHFVFNAMGSIQNLIQNDQKDLADTYLSRFSRLLRLYLESSKNEDILLKDEIQLITKYLEIEKLRFKDRLYFKIMVQPSELDTSTVKIPSLLLQPIIENALGHGLFHKEGGGLISILIEEKAEGLKIIIEDDGIGRAKAAQMKTQTSNSHISRGLEMMKDRISLVNKKGNYRVTLEYHDLIKDSIPLGTRVILNIK